MARLDVREPLAFLRIGFDSTDWVAVFMKRYRTSESLQRVMPLATTTCPEFLAWLRARNAAGWEIYCGTNAITPGQRSRTRTAIGAVRHLFLEADHDGQAFLARLSARSDVPPPSYILRTSPDRVHALWRVAGFSVEQVEQLQRRLARELGGDPAATSGAQTTRIPGFFNRKRAEPYLVSLCCGAVSNVRGPAEFPTAPQPPKTRDSPPTPAPSGGASPLIRARAYLESVPPAIEGQRGDAHTFRVCCRIARGFALEADEALLVLADWNARCQPPWSERELRGKVDHALRYGREPVGGLLAGRANT